MYLKAKWDSAVLFLPSIPVLVTLFSDLAFNFAPFHQNTFCSEFCLLPKASSKQKEIISCLMKINYFVKKIVLNVVLRGHFSDTRFEITLCW